MSESDIDFRDVVQHLSDAIVIIKAHPMDRPGPEIVYANQAYCRKNGYADDEAIGKTLNILELIKSDENADITLPQLLQNKVSTRPIFIEGKAPAEGRWIELTTMPLKDNSGEIAHLLVVEKDISEQKKLETMLEDTTTKDILTSLMNRKAFDEVLLQEFSIFSRTKHTYSLLLIDIDHFKNIHEQRGEAACNQVLSQLAELFDQIFRFYDLTARVGRDQFGVLFRSTSLEHALVSAIRFRQNVQKKEFKAGGEVIHLTVSIGVSQVLPTDTNHIQMVERTEKALKVAKNNGSDQVQIYKDYMAI